MEKNSDTIRALKIMSEHSQYIAVRGNITGEYLDKIGIHNWKVIGCPSFYEPFRQYGESRLKNASLDRAVINVTPGGGMVNIKFLAMEYKIENRLFCRR